MTQDRMHNSDDKRKVVDSYNSFPDIDNVLLPNESSDKIRVVHGSSEQYCDNFNGKTVGHVKKSLREVFNIPADAEAYVGGNKVADDFVLEGGQNLEFLKEAGIKGANL